MADTKISALTSGTPARADTTIIVQSGVNKSATLGDIADLSANGLSNFTAAVNTSSPNATIPVVSLTASNGATNVDIALKPKGTGGIAAHIADSTSTGGDKRGTYAIDWQLVRSASTKVASGQSSVISGGETNVASAKWSTVSGGFTGTASAQGATVGGGQSNTASGSQSTVSGGSSNQATSSTSTIGGGSNNLAQTNSAVTVGGGSFNTASGTYATVGGGQSNTASGGSSGATTVAGGDTNTASAAWASVGGGNSNTASGQYSAIPGGFNNLISGKYSVGLGGYSTDRGIEGAVVHSLGTFYSATAGQCQTMRLQLNKSTTTATAAVMVSNTSAASATNQMALPANSAYLVKGLVVARENATGDSASWEFIAHIKQGANAAATAMVATCTPTQVAVDTGAAAWTIAVAADTTNGALKITVTGEASKTIRWAAHMTSVQAVG